MDFVQQRLEAFHRTVRDSKGECHAKATIVEDLEEHLADDRVLSFYLTLIADPAEFYLARLTALKILQHWKPPSEDAYERVGQQLAKSLIVEKDVLVQQWMAIAAENFANVATVFTATAALVRDTTIDLDVRFNCLSVIGRCGAAEPARAVLRTLASDPELGTSARRILTDRGNT